MKTKAEQEKQEKNFEELFASMEKNLIIIRKAVYEVESCLYELSLREWAGKNNEETIKNISKAITEVSHGTTEEIA
jgi:hypothetical protein